LFERAERGTLFLEEIDCLPVSAQANLLWVLQEGEHAIDPHEFRRRG